MDGRDRTWTDGVNVSILAAENKLRDCVLHFEIVKVLDSEIIFAPVHILKSGNQNVAIAGFASSEAEAWVFGIVIFRIGWSNVLVFDL